MSIEEHSETAAALPPVGQETYNGLARTENTLPGRSYIDPAWYADELQKIFYRQWIFLCHASTLKEPRAFRSFTIGKQSIFVVRDDEGTLRGYHNTCRHRGSALCLEHAGRFKSPLIRCPYHQWAYGLDGRLVATTSLAEAPDFDKQDYPLYPVAVHEWRGCVFVSLADDPPDLATSFERDSDRIDSWPLEHLEVGHTWRKVMQCNWKVFWENFNECLHCPNIHPELCDLVPIYGRRISQVRDDPGWQDHAASTDPKYTGGLKPGAETWSVDGTALKHGFPGLSEEEKARGQSYFVSLPSVFIAAHVDYMRTVRILPLSVDETEIEVEWLFSPEVLADPDFDKSNIVDFAKIVMEQDATASELNQKGMHSQKYDHGVLMPEEHYVKAFHDWVRTQMDGSGFTSVSG